MAARFVDVSETEIDQFKENPVPQKTKDATKFGVKIFKSRLIKFLFCKSHNLLKTDMFIHIFLLQSVSNFFEIFFLQNGFNSSKSSQMK